MSAAAAAAVSAAVEVVVVVVVVAAAEKSPWLTGVEVESAILGLSLRLKETPP